MTTPDPAARRTYPPGVSVARKLALEQAVVMHVSKGAHPTVNDALIVATAKAFEEFLTRTDDA